MSTLHLLCLHMTLWSLCVVMWLCVVCVCPCARMTDVWQLLHRYHKYFTWARWTILDGRSSMDNPRWRILDERTSMEDRLWKILDGGSSIEDPCWRFPVRAQNSRASRKVTWFFANVIQHSQSHDSSFANTLVRHMQTRLLCCCYCIDSHMLLISTLHLMSLQMTL